MKTHRTEDGRLLFHCPGCGCCHGPVVVGDYKWDWNGDLESPTLNPSVLCKWTKPLSDTEVAQILDGKVIIPKDVVCHLYIRNGMIQYLADCTHDLAGQTIPMVDI